MWFCIFLQTNFDLETLKKKINNKMLYLDSHFPLSFHNFAVNLFWSHYIESQVVDGRIPDKLFHARKLLPNNAA